MRKNLKRIRQPSEELLKNIEATHLVPFDVELKLPLFLTEAGMRDSPQVLLGRLLKELEQFPKLIDCLMTETDESLTHYPVSEDREKQHAAILVHRFMEFIKDRDFLKLLVEIAEQYRKHLEVNKFEYQKNEPVIKQLEGMLRLNLPAAEASKSLSFVARLGARRFKVSSQYNGADKWYMAALNPDKKYLGGAFFESAIDYMELTADDQQHQIKIESGGLIRLVQGLDLRRFKTCAKCQNIFWAFRLDSNFCSKSCSTSGSQKKFQSDPKKRAAYNEQRRANYDIKKERKNRERNKNNATL